ncbi:terpene synthase [Trichoderma sp. SZMC 28012]
MSSQAAIIAALKGQTLRIPNLTALFQAWPPQTLNEHYQESVTLTTNTILKIASIAPHLQIERRLRDDIALAACLWYPLAPKLRLEALVLYVVWVVCWDDTIDTVEGDLGADFARAEQWRERTLAIAKDALNLPGTSPDGEVDAINAVLADFGQRYAEEAPLHERQRMYDELVIYIDACSTEQKMRLSEAVPSFDEYMAFREGTIGGGLFCALIPYAMSRDVPPEMLSSSQIPVLRRQINVLMSFINDPLSLKKELNADCVLNVVCSLLTPETTLDDVMAQMLQKLENAVRQFDEAAGEFISQLVHDDNLHSLARELVDGYRRIATGLLEFTLKSPRYNLARLLRQDGSLEIVL